MQKLINAAFSSSTSKKQTQVRQYADENSCIFGDERFSDQMGVIQSGVHSKKPSFSLTSDFSRQYLPNQTMSECKSTFGKNLSGDMSHSLFNKRKQPKEIEELFESTRNFYKNRDAQQVLQESRVNGGTSMSGTSIIKQSFDHVNNHKKAANAHFQPRRPQQIYSSTKKPAQIVRIEKKCCNDEEALAFNSLTSYKKDRSSSHSIDSPLSSQSAKSVQQLMKARQFQLPQSEGLQDLQLFSMPSSVKSDQNDKMYQFKNISSTYNNQSNKMRQPQIHAINLVAKNNDHQGQSTNMRQSMDKIANQKQFISLDSQRFQQKLKKQQIQESTATHYSKVQQKAYQLPLQKQLKSPQKSVSHSYQVQSHKYAVSHAVPKIQDKSSMPEPKRLSDESNESIHSCDMSKSYSKRSLNKKKSERDIKFVSPDEAKFEVKQINDTNKQLFSFNAGLLDSQRSNGSNLTNAQQLFQQQTDYQSRQQTLQSVLNDSSKQNLHCSSNSARKRAKWDLSLGKNTLQNSLIKIQSNKHDGPKQSIQPLHIEEDSSNQIEMLQKQFLAIKKQLQDLKIADKVKKQRRNPENMSYEKHTMSVMSPNTVEDSDEDRSDLSSDYRNKSSVVSNRRRHSKIADQRTHHQMLNNGKTRQKKASNHFKSVDAKFAPIYGEQSPHIHHPRHGTTMRDTNRDDSCQHSQSQSQYMKKINVMKSQLQLGLRKLSVNKQTLESEILLKKHKHDASHHKKRQNRTHQKHSRHDCRSQMSYICSSHGSSIDYKDCHSHTRQHICSKRSSGSSKYYMANDGDSLCSCCKNEEKNHNRTIVGHHRLQLEKSHQKSHHKRLTQKVSKPVTTAKKRRPDNYSKHEERPKQVQSKSKKEEVEQVRKSSNKKRKHSKSTQRQRDRPETPQFNQHLLNQHNMYSNQWMLPPGMRQPLDLNAQYSLLNAAQYAQNLNQPQVLPNAFSPNPLQYIHQTPILNTSHVNLPFQAQSHSLPATIQNTMPISRASPNNNQFFGLQKSHNDNYNYESNKQQIEAIETLIKKAKTKLDHNNHTNKPQQCRMQDSIISKSIKTESNFNPKISRNDHVYNYQESYNSNQESASNNNFFQTQISEFSTDDKPQQDFYSQRTFHNPERKLEQRKISQQVELQKSIIHRSNYETKSSHQKPQQEKRLSNQFHEQALKESTIDSQRLSVKQSARKVEDCDLPKQIIPEKLEKDDKEVLWIDFNESKNKQVKRPALTSSHKSSIKTEPSTLPNKVQKKTDQVLTSVVESKGDSKEAWAMDFSNEDANNFSEAMRLKRQSMERRLQKGKEVGSSTTKQAKAFTKKELLERKKELLKNARMNIQTQNGTHSTMNDQQIDLFEPLGQEQMLKTTKVVKIDILGNKTNAHNTSVRSSKDGPIIPLHLVSRLSSGQKYEITKKDMIKLTNRNYEQLPEIKKKKLEEGKKEDLMKRLANVKELEKKRRQSVVNKRQKQLQKPAVIDKENTQV